MVGWHHRLSGPEFKQAPGDGERQGSLTCCSPWGLKESDKTERLNLIARRACCGEVLTPTLSLSHLSGKDRLAWWDVTAD